MNDASDDDSVELLTSMARKYEHLRIFDLEQNLNFFSGKKFPLSLGIKSAKNEIVLLTDARRPPENLEALTRALVDILHGGDIDDSQPRVL